MQQRHHLLTLSKGGDTLVSRQDVRVPPVQGRDVSARSNSLDQ